MDKSYIVFSLLFYFVVLSMSYAIPMTRLTTHSTLFFIPATCICHCVTFTLFPSWSGYTGWIWIGGRKSVIDPGTGNIVWVWGNSEDHIDLGLWQPGHPNGGTTHDRVHIYNDPDGRLSDYIGSHNSHFLCETAESNLVCESCQSPTAATTDQSPIPNTETCFYMLIRH